ncbi:MAG: hypothetical protein JSS94_01850 [Bacteroidetes bacterium]|nr:hypothetical protein [Bacteroidota bacterium]
MKKSLIIGGLLATTCIMAQTYDLKLNLEKGKNYEVFQNVKTKMIQNMMGQQVPVNIDAEVGISTKVLESTAQGIRLETQFTYVSSKSESMGNRVSISSEKCNQDENAKILCSLVNKKFIVLMSNKGKVLSIEGNKEILNQIIKENPAENPMVKDGKIFEIYKDDNIKAMFENLFNFPQQPIKIGDSWTSKYKTNSGFEVENSSKYTLNAVDAQQYTIHVQTDLKTVDNQIITNNGIEMTPNFTGNGTSEVILNKNTGWLVKSKSTSELKGDITVPSMSNMKIEMKTNTEAELLPVAFPNTQAKE